MNFKLSFLILILVLLFGIITPKSARADCVQMYIDPSSGNTETVFTAQLRNCDKAAGEYELRLQSENGATRTIAFTDIGNGAYSATIGLLTSDRYLAEFLESNVFIGFNGPFEVSTPGNQGGGGSNQGGGVKVPSPIEGCGIPTAIGCIPINDLNSISRFALQWAIGIAGGIGLIFIASAAFRIMTSIGDPRRLQSGNELLTSAIAGIVMVVLSVFLLRVLGVNVLGLFPG